MSDLAVSLFGKMQVRVAGEPIPSIPQKARELLVYLLLHRRPHPREKLGTVLWEHGTTERVKAYLRKALWHLQRVIETGDRPVLLVDGDWVQIHPQANVWVDVADFEDAAGCLRTTSAASMTPEQARELEEAAALYTSDLLETWYQDWCLLERERLQNLLLRVLDRLALWCERQGTYGAGVQYAHSTLRIDPSRERMHRRLMRLHARAGNRTCALRQYERCVQVLREELDVEPSTATQCLYERIRTNQFPASESVPAEVSADAPARRLPSAAPPPISDPRAPVDDSPIQSLQDSLDRIQELQSTLVSVQEQIQSEIEAVEGMLRKK